MNDTGHLPPERRLPPRRRDQILRSVLDGEEPHMSTRFSRPVRWIAPIAAAAVAALIAVGAVALSDGDGGQSGGTAPAGQPSEKTVPLDLGPLSDAEVRDLLAQRFGSDLDQTTFHYTRRIDGPAGPVPVVLATLPGEQDVFYQTGNVVGMTEDPEPTAQHPIQPVEPFMTDADSGAGDAIYSEKTYWKIVGMYHVADTVDRIEVRVGTPDGPEPWRVADPYGGYVFWAAWFDPAEYEPGTELTVRWRAYDTDGQQIDPDLLPHQSRTVMVPGR